MTAEVGNAKDVKHVIDDARIVIAALNSLLKTAAPLVHPVLALIDMDAVAAKVKEIAQDAPDKVKDVVDTPLKAAAQLFDIISETKDQYMSEAAKKKAEKEIKKAIKGVRQSVLESAMTTITASNYLKTKGNVGAVNPVSSLPGCFVIATYKNIDFDKDLTDYISIYIGKADNAAQGVDLAISRDGDPDVYADVKYKQNVHIFVYNCLPEELEGQYASLVETFADVEVGE